MSSTYPYIDRFPVLDALPALGRPRAEVLEELTMLAREEDAAWEQGTCSGTMYCGDHDHYDFLGDVFGAFAHVNVLQRDMCPSATRFEGEIIAMTLDMLGADAIFSSSTGGDPVGMVTSGGSGSILHAVLAYREQRGVSRPNLVKPETGHPAFDKACHLLGVELRTVPVDPVSTCVVPDELAGYVDADTIAIVGSACNYGYGTVDPIPALSELAMERDVGLHVDGCLGGFILPWGRELGYPIPEFDFALDGVTSISADTHKYGYGFKGTSVLVFRDRALRNAQYFFQTDWTGGKYCSPGIDGSRSGGLLASTWASMVSLGRQGYLDYAREIFATADDMKEAVRFHDSLRIIGEPTFCFSFTSDEFDIYHLNDHMRTKGWRFNGQQYPNAIHMAVTRPQTQNGVSERFAVDLAEAIDYARGATGPAKSGAIYGGVEGGWNEEADGFIRAVMSDMMDKQQALPDLDPSGATAP